MAHHWMDNVHTTAFSPRDYQVELLAAAREKNTLICLGHNSSKEFIALKLIHELAHQVRSSPSAPSPAQPHRHTLYLCADGQSAYNQIFHLTDLTVVNINEASRHSAAGEPAAAAPEPEPIDWPRLLAAAHVLICSPRLCLQALRSGQLRLGAVNLLCIADCHLSQFRADLCAILDEFVSPLVPVPVLELADVRAPLILGLAGPLHSAGCPPGHLAAELRQLESQMRCRAESASDIVTVLRYCSAPRELLVECAPRDLAALPDAGAAGAAGAGCAGELSALLRDLVQTRLAWLGEHRFDPSEIYSDEFLEEMQSYPDPKAEPMALLREFLEVLDELGAWSADRAANTALHTIEKLKVKTPYERHFLLLCMVSTMFVQVRAHCHEAFARCPATSDRERIELYSTPKVLRLLEVLRLFRTASATADNALAAAKDTKSAAAAGLRPASGRPVRANERTAPALAALDALNFAACGQAAAELQLQLQPDQQQQPPATTTTESMDVHKLTRNLQRMLPPSACPHPPALRLHQNQRGRGPRPGWTQRLDDPNALCGLLFCDSRLVAKCLFQLLNEMSRQPASDLAYLSVQFTVDRQADPLSEPKEAEAEHRRQEDVLRRFRMHDCNLLIGTPVLEEGIDLPKCNLVMRWNAPRTYRSYVQCKGRARAPNAFHIVMVGSTKTMRTVDKEPQSKPTAGLSLSDHNHRLVCEQPLLNRRPDESGTELATAENASRCKLAATIGAAEAAAATEAARRRQLHQMQLITAAQVDEMAKYMHIEQLLLRQCENNEPTLAEQQHADRFTALLDAYRPAIASAATTSATGVTLATAIALLNKYCAKLPSDTFTKLTPLWRCARTERLGCGTSSSSSATLYLYTLRLPINSPVKQDILGLPMPTRILARRVAALIACRTLHLSGELDGNLQPIGKESFRATEPDWENFELEPADEAICNGNQEPRPGTTKRRQYYYKRIAEAFCDCRPRVDTECYLYLIRMTLECPIPEEQNTRGRRIYPPEEAAQGFGILTSKPIPKISSFPIFTRSGEVKVSLELVGRRVQFDAQQLQHINTFLNFTFTKVLRLQKYLMLFDAEASENSFYIVPTVRAKSDRTINVDWAFLEMIAGAHGRMPVPVPEPQRRAASFDVEQWRDAVVMPWYRNQDQPQYFYVAEICEHLSPESAFPGDHYSTFREYYGRKYDINIQNQRQPLLDVDHTSARLNFLTPRYVNRKGVALPTSSEETKRAKRENLEQKQILVPELCTIHPFPASLWRAAVCLPCILYRFNALLLADEIRMQVAHDLGGHGGGGGAAAANGHPRGGGGDNSAAGEVIGRRAQLEVVAAADFEWPMLNFGWTLVEVLRKSREAKAAKLMMMSSGGGAAAAEPGEVRENGRAGKEKEAKAARTGGGGVKREAGDDELEIGTWTNEMADDLELSGGSFDSGQNEIPGLPANVKMCSSVDSRVRYGSPTSWNAAGLPNASNGTERPRPAANTSGGRNSGYFSDLDDSFGSDCSDDDDDDDGDFDTDSADNTDSDGALKIEFQSDHVAEAIESEEEIQRRQRQLEIIQTINASEKAYQEQKNIGLGYDAFDGERAADDGGDGNFASSIAEQAGRFDVAIDKFRQRITGNGNGGDASEMLVRHDESLQPRIGSRQTASAAEAIAISQMSTAERTARLAELLPFVGVAELQAYADRAQPISLDDLFAVHRTFFERTPLETYTIEGTGDLFDQFNYSPFETATDDRSPTGAKTMQLPATEFFRDRVVRRVRNTRGSRYSQIATTKPLPAAKASEGDAAAPRAPFSFDAQPDLRCHPGPSPSVILQALTMSNANDGINLERLETIGDSFLKYAITTYLYCTYEDVHEGKLSHLRSKQVSNLNLYRLGRRKMFGECMIATKFEPQDNWLPPCYYVPKELEKALIAAGIPAYHWNLADLPNIKELSSEQICALVKRKADALDQSDALGMVEKLREETVATTTVANGTGSNAVAQQLAADAGGDADDHYTCFIPYNLVTQHSIPDKSVADCVEALIGAYLIECGQRGALLFMAWLGIRVLPCVEAAEIAEEAEVDEQQQLPPMTEAAVAGGGGPCSSGASIYGHWSLPKSPLLTHTAQPHRTLDRLLNGYERFEQAIGYTFRDRSYLLQSMTHASYSANRLTDCYQRLEFLGDAVLDYLITRHLYEDPRQHSPGALTDLRSALVNNTIFASLAVRHGFHKYFRHLSPGLNDVIERFVRIQHENGHRISEEFYLISEDECDEAEDVEVPKALGDVFESVAGAIFLDSNMSLDTVWRIYSNMMRPEIELFSNSVPKSPIRELLEMEPETAKFSKPEKLTDGRRVRVSVEVFGKGTFRGIGRNYRIAKCTAAKCALRQLKKQGLIRK